MSEQPPPDPASDPAADPAAFWHLGPLPAPPTGPTGPTGPDPARQGTTLDQLGRPEITVDGRNLADLLAPAYRLLAPDPQ